MQYLYFQTILLTLLSVNFSSFSNDNFDHLQQEFFDYIIEKDSLEIELYKLMSKAKNKVFLLNYPSLNTRHTKLDQDIFVSLMGDLKKRGVEIKVLHQTQKKLYPLTISLFNENITNINQNDSNHSYRFQLGTKYAIIDNTILVIEQIGEKSRIVGLKIDSLNFSIDYNEIWEDSKYSKS